MQSFLQVSSFYKLRFISLIEEGMVEFIGLLKVTVKKGTNLAIRDMMSSDPYVVLNLGRDANDTTTCGGSWRGQPSSSAYCFSRILTFLV